MRFAYQLPSSTRWYATITTVNEIFANRLVAITLPHCFLANVTKKKVGDTGFGKKFGPFSSILQNVSESRPSRQTRGNEAGSHAEKYAHSSRGALHRLRHEKHEIDWPGIPRCAGLSLSRRLHPPLTCSTKFKRSTSLPEAQSTLFELTCARIVDTALSIGRRAA